MPSNRATLEAANALIRAGDLEGFLEHCTDDTTWTYVGDRTLRGKDAVRASLAVEYRRPPVFTVDEVVEDGDVVVAIGVISLVGEDGPGDPQAYCDVWRFRDGRMAELRAFVVPAGEDEPDL